jgi:hypothetical protein
MDLKSRINKLVTCNLIIFFYLYILLENCCYLLLDLNSQLQMRNPNGDLMHVLVYLLNLLFLIFFSRSINSIQTPIAFASVLYIYIYSFDNNDITITTTSVMFSHQFEVKLHFEEHIFRVWLFGFRASHLA